MTTVALALSGGGAAGLGHIPVLCALDDLGLKPVAIAGTSIGALIGAAYASGLSGIEISEHIKALAGSPFASVHRFLRQSAFGPFKSLAALDAVAAVQTVLPSEIPERFEDLRMPLTTVATDYHGRKAEYFKNGALLPALATSIAIPGVFQPVRVAGRLYVDGGVTNNVPVNILPSADLILAVDATSGPPDEAQYSPNQRTIVIESMRIMVRARLEMHLRERPETVLLEPGTRKFGALDFHKTKDILRYADTLYEPIKRDIAQAVELTEKPPIKTILTSLKR